METDDARYRRAKQRVVAVRSFYVHGLTYLGVNLFLFLLNLLTRGPDGPWWFYWPLLGWGVGVASHAFSVFGAHGIFGPDWEERKIREYIDREKKRAEPPK